MTEKEHLPVLDVDREEINPRVLVCGDPARAKQVGQKLEQPREVSYNREYRLINGELSGSMVSVVSHGVGAAGAAVCFEELIRGGGKEIIRIGTAGSLDREIIDGDIVIATGAIREDGVGEQLVALSFPAVSDHEVTRRLEDAVNKRKRKTHKGIILTVGAFYQELEELPGEYFSKTGAIAVEMEASILFIIASLNDVRAGGIFTIDGMAIDFQGDEYDPDREVVHEGINESIGIALEALSPEHP